MRLAAIYLHPVKSTRPLRVARAEALPRGFRYDRRWMIVDADGRFVSQREDPRLGRIVPRLEGDALVLEHELPSGSDSGGTVSSAARDLPPLELPAEPRGEPTRTATIWDDEVAVIDAGDDAAAWLASQLGPGHRLVGMPEGGHRPVDPKRALPGDEVSFADGVPYLLANLASLRDLERRAGMRLDVRRFRPNLVIDGAEPFAEDGWSELRIGPVRFRAVGACVRCVVTTLDPDDGEASKEPLRTLATFRRREDGGVTFGENLIADGGDGKPATAARTPSTRTLSEGDEVLASPRSGSEGAR